MSETINNVKRFQDDFNDFLDSLISNIEGEEEEINEKKIEEIRDSFESIKQEYTILLIGAQGVGKTALLHSLIDSNYKQSLLPTFSKVRYSYDDDSEIEATYKMILNLDSERFDLNEIIQLWKDDKKIWHAIRNKREIMKSLEEGNQKIQILLKELKSVRWQSFDDFMNEFYQSASRNSYQPRDELALLIDEVNIDLPGNLKVGMKIVDTSGIDSLYKLDRNTYLDEMNRADLIVFFVEPRGLSSGDKDFLNFISQYNKQIFNRMLVVLSKVDEALKFDSEAGIDVVLETLRENFSTISGLPKTKDIFFKIGYQNINELDGCKLQKSIGDSFLAFLHKEMKDKSIMVRLDEVFRAINEKFMSVDRDYETLIKMEKEKIANIELLYNQYDVILTDEISSINKSINELEENVQKLAENLVSKLKFDDVKEIHELKEHLLDRKKFAELQSQTAFQKTLSNLEEDTQKVKEELKMRLDSDKENIVCSIQEMIEKLKKEKEKSLSLLRNIQKEKLSLTEKLDNLRVLSVPSL